MKLKHISVPFVLSLIAIIAVRAYQFSSIGDAKVRLKWPNLELICVAIVLALLVLAIIMSMLSKGIPNFLNINKNLFTGIIGTLAGILVSCNGLADIFKFITAKEKDMLILFLGIFGVAAGIIFIGLSFCFIKGSNLFENKKILLLLPTIWGLLRLLQMFFIYNSISTNIIEMSDEFAVIFLLLFMFYQSKLFAGIINNFAFRANFIFGFTATLFIIVYCSYEVLKSMDTGVALEPLKLLSLATDLALGIYIPVFLLSLNANSNTKEIIEYEKELEAKGEENTPKKEVENKESTDVDMEKVDYLINQIEQENIGKQGS